MRFEHLCPSATPATRPRFNARSNCSSPDPPRQWRSSEAAHGVGADLSNAPPRTEAPLPFVSLNLTFVTIYLSLGLLQNNENPDKSGNVQRR
jgi:hypothetical protein